MTPIFTTSFVHCWTEQESPSLCEGSLPNSPLPRLNMENRTIAVGLGHASPIAETGEEWEWDRECVCPLVWKCFISEQLISREGHTRQHRSLMDPGPCVVIATGGVLLPNDFLSLSRRFTVPVHLCMACSLGWPINAIQSFRDPFGRYQ